MLNKGDAIILTPQCYPCVKWEGVVLGFRKTKYERKVKVQYDCGGMMLTGMFSEKEIKQVTA